MNGSSRSRLRPVTDTPPRAIIYLRQSHYREESISLELQELACRDYCERMGYAVTAVEADPGISGRTWKRPAVQRVMAAIEAHDADVIILWKWSRLSRSRKDWALAIDRADVAGGKIESATEPIDTATASGRFARGVMTEYAAFQSEQIGEQWEEVRQRRLKMGLPVSGRLPFGWSWESGHIAPHPQHAPLVVEMYRRYLSGDGAASIARWLNSLNVPAPNGGLWGRSRPLTVMDSPVHAGLIPYRGETFRGEHEPIIDPETWASYQDERTRRKESRQKPRSYAHLLSALVRCECGAPMYGKGSVTGGKLYRGYLCEHTTGEHPQRAYVSALTIEPVVIDWLMTFDPEVDTSVNSTVQQAELARIRRQMNELEVEAVKAARGPLRDSMPGGSFDRLMAELTAELDRLRLDERRLMQATREVPTREFLVSMRDSWLQMTMSEQNKVARKIIAMVKVKDDAARFEILTTWGKSFIVS